MNSKGRRERDGECERSPPEKRHKIEAGPEQGQDGKDDGNQTSQQGQPGNKQVLGALKKIGAHIGNLSKFKKASSLFRQLFEQGVLTPEIGDQVFEVIAASMSDPLRCQDPSLRKEYWKMITAACSQCHLFDSPQRSQLDVYQIWAVLLSEMQTDDPFIFNKVLKKIQEIIEGLPKVQEEDEAAFKKWQTMCKVQDQDGSKNPKKQEEKETSDPFNLDALLDTDPENRITWTDEICRVARRAALVDCLRAATDKYHRAWACTSVDILINAAYKHKSAFCVPQQREIRELWHFTKQGKAVRRQGPTDVEIRRDTTTFEQARSEWSKSSISHRGKVGAGGDHKSEMWLG